MHSSFSLLATRAKVWHSRIETTLFDVKAYAGDMEKVFFKIWGRHEKGEEPDHITELSTFK